MFSLRKSVKLWVLVSIDRQLTCGDASSQLLYSFIDSFVYVYFSLHCGQNAVQNPRERGYSQSTEREFQSPSPFINHRWRKRQWRPRSFIGLWKEQRLENGLRGGPHRSCLCLFVVFLFVCLLFFCFCFFYFFTSRKRNLPNRIYISHIITNIDITNVLGCFWKARYGLMYISFISTC